MSADRFQAELEALCREEGIPFRHCGEHLLLGHSDDSGDYAVHLAEAARRGRESEDVLRTYRELDARRGRVLNALRHLLRRAGIAMKAEGNQWHLLRPGILCDDPIDVGEPLSELLLDQDDESALYRLAGLLETRWQQGRNLAGVNRELTRRNEGPDAEARLASAYARVLGPRIEEDEAVLRKAAEGDEAFLRELLEHDDAPPPGPHYEEAQRLDEDLQELLHPAESSVAEATREDGLPPGTAESAEEGDDSLEPPGLPDLSGDESLRYEIHAHEILEAYYRHCEGQDHGYVTSWPYLLPGDTWVDKERLRAVAHRRLDQGSAVVVEVSDHEALLALGDESRKAEAVRLLDQWWDDGADDWENADHLVERLTPQYRDEKEWAGTAGEWLVDPLGEAARDLHLGHPSGRRWFEKRFSELFASLRAAGPDRVDRVADQLMETAGHLRDGWAERLLSQTQLRRLRELLHEAAHLDQDVYADWSLDLLRAAMVLEEKEVGRRLLEAPKVHAVFFSTSGKITDLVPRLSGLPTVEATRGERVLDLGSPYDLHHWRQYLLLLSLWFPEEPTTRRLAALALDRVSEGRPRPRDTLAAAIAWHRTTHPHTE